jgi:membrane fusion protein, multidrug efflux system
MRLRLVFATLVLSATLSGCDNTTATNDTAPRHTPVGVATAYEGAAAPSIRTNGLLVNKDEIRLAFKVGGIVKRVRVAQGERVHRGQGLAEIELAEVNAQVEQARQMADKAQRDFERGERLYGDKVISLEQLQDLKTQAAVARAALESAEFNSDYAAIVAPRDGIVLRKLVEERELVAAGAPVLVIGAEDRGYVVRAGLADREIVQVKLGDTAEIRLDAHPEAVLHGTVTERASAADPGSGMFEIEVALQATPLPLASGLVAKIHLTPASANSAKLVYVPISAIVEGDGRRASVFVLQGELARRRPVNIAFIENEAVALTAGLKSGEQVITDGVLYLEDGEHVRPQAAAAAADAPTVKEPS